MKKTKKNKIRPQSVLAVVLFCLISFFAGIGLTLSTRNGEAKYGLDIEGQVLGVTDEAPAKPIDLKDFANTTISKLNDYMQGPATEEELLVKKEKVKNYLEYKKSPFAKDPATLDTLVHAPHMKLILGIAFAESALGKNCADYNCSGIGSAPDRPYWREYKSHSNWILDFNRLLERRYKDWTLKQMCGVYVQPCNENWLAATGQISRELAEWGIE